MSILNEFSRVVDSAPRFLWVFCVFPCEVMRDYFADKLVGELSQTRLKSDLNPTSMFQR